jgi:hypothetical protein
VTGDITPERQEQIDEALGEIIFDPDPGRRVLACDDCRTPTLATYDVVLSVAHDATCPAYAAMTPDERIEEIDGVTVVHVVIGEGE